MASVRHLLSSSFLASGSSRNIYSSACRATTSLSASSQLKPDPNVCVTCKSVRHEHSGPNAPDQRSADQLLQYWRGLLSKGTQQGTANADPVKSAWQTKDMQDLLHTAIRVRHGRVSGVLPEQLLATFMQVYQKTMGSEDRRRLFLLVCQDFGVQDDKIDKAIQAWQQASTRGADAVLRSLEQLQQASQPLYANLFLPFSNQPGGIKFLVDLRADVRAAIKQSPATAGPLRALDRHLRESLATWFSVGLLHLQPVQWETSPASLLQKVMAYEAVHPFKGWNDLKQRLGPMRRAHAFMHPSMPQEPLVILHCALQKGPAASMAQILPPCALPPHPDGAVEDITTSLAEVTDPHDADNAVFYSISSTQKGLAGVDLGNFLIKQVAQKVLAEFPGVQNLVTLSPIPGFSKWLYTQTDMRNKPERALLSSKDLDALQARPQSALQQPEKWKPVLMRLCAHYLLNVRRRNLVFDPVANFHLRNGATVWRLNWAADTSTQALSASFGIMVNYRYVLDSVHSNTQSYLVDRTIPAAQAVRELACPTA